MKPVVIPHRDHGVLLAIVPVPTSLERIQEMVRRHSSKVADGPGPRVAVLIPQDWRPATRSLCRRIAASGLLSMMVLEPSPRLRSLGLWTAADVWACAEDLDVNVHRDLFVMALEDSRHVREAVVRNIQA